MFSAGFTSAAVRLSSHLSIAIPTTESGEIMTLTLPKLCPENRKRLHKTSRTADPKCV